jgi:hypothetical protein
VIRHLIQPTPLSCVIFGINSIRAS